LFKYSTDIVSHLHRAAFLAGARVSGLWFYPSDSQTCSNRYPNRGGDYGLLPSMFYVVKRTKPEQHRGFVSALPPKNRILPHLWKPLFYAIGETPRWTVPHATVYTNLRTQNVSSEWSELWDVGDKRMRNLKN